MKIFKVRVEDRFYLSSTSKGNQIKWFKDGIYLKADTMGYESFAEALASELLRFVKLDFDYIEYYLCNIAEDGTDYTGCYSYNYLAEDESFISFYRLLQKQDKRVDISIRKYKGVELVNYVLSLIKNISGIDCANYIGCILKFDALVLNEDRHLNNINLIYNSSSASFRLAPIFDNGLSLLSDINDYPVENSINECIRKVKSKPFATDFMKQVSYFGGDLLKIDYAGFISSLKENEDVFNCREYRRARSVILHRLKSLEGRIWERV